MADCTHSSAAESLKIPMSCSDNEDNDRLENGPETSICRTKDPHYRKLSIASVICGCSCIGIFALINSVKAETSTNKARKDKYSGEARKFALTSIGVFVGILVLIPSLTVFISYLITLRE